MNNPYDNYLEAKIFSARPVERVHMLYRAAITAIREARHHLADRRIRERSESITSAIEILCELSSSLRHEAGGELSANLAALYDYMQRRLIDANATQTEGPLAEVLGLLQPLEEAWATLAVSTGQAAAETAAIPFGDPAASQHSLAGHGWVG